ncbi:MAG: DUF1318 domain-containing protein [Alphaproteobacteria bacterium]|nr:DUF1318 domain-containing protein [Alphaproteobacteria bacterium]
MFQNRKRAARSALSKALALGFLAWVAAIAPVGASAQNLSTLDRFLVAGDVGERYDGYLTIRRKEATPQVKALVKTVNRQRRSFYAQAAERAKTRPEYAARVYAQHIQKKAPRGAWFLAESGDWVRKF